MRKLDWDNAIIGADGVTRSRKEIEDFFCSAFENAIKINLENLRTNQNFIDALPQMQNWIERIIDKLHDILLANPNELEDFRIKWDSGVQRYVSLGTEGQDARENEITDLTKRLLSAFGYEGFRKSQLNELAVILNVKSCMYCNQHYTIAVGNVLNKNDDINLRGSKAFLQFDHFFSKKKYPFLSMSLYNLIPSCPMCNQIKGKMEVPVSLHPYSVNLSDEFVFRIKNQNAFIKPVNIKTDLLEVEVVTKNPDLKELAMKLKLERRYSRHIDIAEELECALYVERYYGEGMLGLGSDKMKEFMKWESEERCLNSFERYLKGFYPDPNDINRRPLTKFSQDIYAQLSTLHGNY